MHVDMPDVLLRFSIDLSRVHHASIGCKSTRRDSMEGSGGCCRHRPPPPKSAACPCARSVICAEIFKTAK